MGEDRTTYPVAQDAVLPDPGPAGHEGEGLTVGGIESGGEAGPGARSGAAGAERSANGAPRRGCSNRGRRRRGAASGPSMAGGPAPIPPARAADRSLLPHRSRVEITAPTVGYSLRGCPPRAWLGTVATGKVRQSHPRRVIITRADRARMTSRTDRGTTSTARGSPRPDELARLVAQPRPPGRSGVTAVGITTAPAI